MAEAYTDAFNPAKGTAALPAYLEGLLGTAHEREAKGEPFALHLNGQASTGRFALMLLPEGLHLRQSCHGEAEDSFIAVSDFGGRGGLRDILSRLVDAGALADDAGPAPELIEEE